MTYLIVAWRCKQSYASKTACLKKNIDAKYWRNVDIQDQFWQRTFVQFVRPLQKLYKDPISAGAHLLSAYLTDAASLAREFVSDPAEFGQLNYVASINTARAIYEELLAGHSGIALDACAQKFAEQRAASTEIAEFAAQYPKLYWELQKDRSARKEGQKPTVKVQFFGKSLDLSKAVRPKKARRKGNIKSPKGS
jgi:hypothetical protein